MIATARERIAKLREAKKMVGARGGAETTRRRSKLRMLRLARARRSRHGVGWSPHVAWNPESFTYGKKESRLEICVFGSGIWSASKKCRVKSFQPPPPESKTSRYQNLKISKSQNFKILISKPHHLKNWRRAKGSVVAPSPPPDFCPMADQPDVQPNPSRKQRKLLLPPEVPRPMDKGERWNPRGGRRRRRSWQEPLPPSPAASSLLPPSGGQVAQCSSTSLHQVAPMDPRLSIPTSAAGYDVAARALSSSNSTTDVRFPYSGRLLSRASDAAQASSFTTNTFLEETCQAWMVGCSSRFTLPCRTVVRYAHMHFWLLLASEFRILEF